MKQSVYLYGDFAVFTHRNGDASFMKIHSVAISYFSDGNYRWPAEIHKNKSLCLMNVSIFFSLKAPSSCERTIFIGKLTQLSLFTHVETAVKKQYVFLKPNVF